MATAKKWTPKDLEEAIRDVQEGKCSVRAAAARHDVPKSTLHDHVSMKVNKISKPGPSPILREDEEDELVKWIKEMNSIGYGQCRQQVCLVVKRWLDSNERPNPFPNNLPGKDWWYAFLRRHPDISLRTPQALETCRASACTPAVINKWYHDYEQFVLVNDLLHCPSKIWNCDESGFSLCPKSNKVLAPTGVKHVYHSTSSSKVQITTLVCINAAGNAIPPMHIFPGQRFSYNPMHGCVEGAYFGKSPNGWITQELFHGWLTKHFTTNIPPGRPVCLLVDGHSSHIDLETSKFCRDNKILLYCLPPHSSHITQPLDVGFFSPLKQSWRSAVASFNCKHAGSPIDKTTFSQVFRTAYLAAMKPTTIINSFERSGIFPPNGSAIDDRKLLPSKVYDKTIENPGQSDQTPNNKNLALIALEEEMD